MSAAPTDPVGGDAARRAARAELSRPEYHHDGPGVLHRVGDWISRQFDKLLGAGGGNHAILLVVVVLLLVVVLVAARAGVPRRAAAVAGAPDDPLAAADARDHRRIAAGFESDGRHADALREWLRAAVATIEERGVLPVRPGRTGARTALEAGPVLPTAANDLVTAMTAFDQVWFGGRPATPADVRSARAAADAVRTARLRGADGAGHPDGIAAPW